MKINLSILKNYIDIPVDVSTLRDTMEDIGLEVKRIDMVNDDAIMTLELLANRGDHYSYFGIAREIYGRTKWDMKYPEQAEIRLQQDSTNVEIRTDSCLNYTLTEFKLEGDDKVELPLEYKKILEASGANSIFSAVDVTNIVNSEIGQPLHAFDADLINGKITVRKSVVGERAHLLFQEEPVDLPAGITVIADDANILAVAGVMGCEAAKPSANTKRIYLESATFEPVSVRKAARALNIQSASSMRFERGADPELAINAVKRAKHLLESLGWKMSGAVESAVHWDYLKKEVPFSTEAFNHYFGSDYQQTDLSDRLERYGFNCKIDPAELSDKIKVLVPSHRIWDVKEDKDLFEELARSIGYNEFPSVLPRNTAGIKVSPWLDRKYKVEGLLINQGFYEVFTDGFYGEKNLKNLGITDDHPLAPHVKTINAEDRLYSYMKNNTLSQAMDLVQVNQSVKNSNIKAFEWTRTFHPNKEAENGLCDERLVFWMVASGNSRDKTWKNPAEQVDVFYMKGLVEEISDILDLKLDVKQSVCDDDIPAVGTCLHPTRRAGIYHADKLVGVIGEVHPSVLKNVGIKHARPCFVELSQDVLKMSPDLRTYVAPSNLLPIIRDVCLVLPKDVSVRDIANEMKANSTWLTSVNITDIFNSEATEWKDAITFSMAYSLEKAGKERLTTEDINTETDRTIDVVIDNFKKKDVFIYRRTEDNKPSI